MSRLKNTAALLNSLGLGVLANATVNILKLFIL